MASGVFDPEPSPFGGFEAFRSSYTPPADAYLHPNRGGADRRRSVSSSMSSGTDNVKVVCRVRPFNQRELDLHAEANEGAEPWDCRPLRSVIEMNANSTKFLDHTNDFNQKEEFRFDENLWSIPASQQETSTPFATQATVYEKVGRATIEHAFSGYNTCIFAYGQTGSGKTHTMMGTETDKGLIPRCCENLFRVIQEKERMEANAQNENATVTWKVEARFLEIYNEHVKDLLWQMADPQAQAQFDKENLKVRHIPNQGPYVVGLTSVLVQSWEECNKIIDTGMQNRVVAATKMNDTSSRSHAIFRLTLTQTTTFKPTKQFEKPKTTDRVATINLVDLAGSERLKKSGAQGQRLKEATAINLSLTTLKNVIDALVENRPLIPYRDSQLTWLLSESLGGNSKTFMIACLSPHLDNGDETLNTLRYALRTQGIVNHARVNESDEARRIAALQRELAEARGALQEGAEGQRTVLRREVEEKQEALQDLQKQRYHRLREEKELKEDIEEERRRTFRAVYANAFRARLLERVADKLSSNKAALSRRINEVSQDISRSSNMLRDSENRLKSLTEEEERFANINRRLERDYQGAVTQYNQVNHAIKDMQVSLEALEERCRNANIRKNFSMLISWGVLMGASKKLLKRSDDLLASQSQSIQETSRHGQAEISQTQVQHQKASGKIQSEMDTIRENMTTISQRIQAANDDRKTRVRNLNEDITFYERENRNLNDERVQKLTEIDRHHSTKYQSESSRLSERGVRSRQLAEQQHTALMHEINRQLRMAGSVQEEALAQASETWSGRLKLVEEEAKIAQRKQDEHYGARTAEHEAQIDDARSFIFNWQQKSRHYGAVRNDILRLLADHRRSSDPYIREVIERLEVASSSSRSPSANAAREPSQPAATLAAPNTAVSRNGEFQSGRSTSTSRVGSRRFGTPSPSGSPTHAAPTLRHRR